MEIQLSKMANERLNEASDVLGVEKKEIVDRAVLVYLDDMDKHIKLKKEFEVWDKLSDEALINFEKSL
jgi:hypothetical protein